MASRPEILFPLFAGVETLEGVGPKTVQNLGALGVEKPRDLLFTLPQSGIDRTRRATIREVVAPAVATVDVGAHYPPRSRGTALPRAGA